ncbi:MAG: hypothetical protein ABH846_04570 [Patescibacteria group bacterium]
MKHLFLLAIIGTFFISSQALAVEENDGGQYCETFCELLGLQEGEYYYPDEYEWLVTAMKTYNNNDDIYDRSLGERLSGRVLLQVEKQGQAFYIHPDNHLGYYLANGDAAYTMMRYESLGISETDFSKLEISDDPEAVNETDSICSKNSLANRLKGQVMLRADAHGEAYYIDPVTCIAVYLKDGQTAYNTMRYLGLGITNKDIAKIPTLHVLDILEPGIASSYMDVHLKKMIDTCETGYVEDYGSIIKYTCDDDGEYGYPDTAPDKVVTDYYQNSINLKFDSYFTVYEEFISEEMRMDVPYLVNTYCLARAYENAVESYYYSQGERNRPSDSRFDLFLQEDREVPTILETQFFYDRDTGPIAECTFPLYDANIYNRFGKEILTLEPYLELIEFKVYQNYINAGGYVIGDLQSGDPELIDDYNSWYINRVENWYYSAFDLPPWIDPDNKIETYTDYFRALIEME